jgi:sigma-B regulation protein RsbU (phosphoserine phosphatase)
MEGVRFKEREIELHPGDRIFVYTDGVPEATNAKDELFGVERMLQSLNSHGKDSLQELLPDLKKDIDLFVGEAPQFDDITMLGFEYFGPQK